MVLLESFIRIKNFVQIYAEISHYSEHVNPKSVISNGSIEINDLCTGYNL